MLPFIYMRLSDRLESTFRLSIPQKAGLKKLKIATLGDLLFHFPARYSDLSTIKNINELIVGDRAIIYGKIKSVKISKAFRKKIAIGQAVLEDATGQIKITWFNQPYLVKMFTAGSSVKVAGKVAESKSGIYLANPEIEKTKDFPIDSHNSLFQKNGHGQGGPSFYPVYPETRGITSRWFYHGIKKILSDMALDEIKDSIPEEILKKYSLPNIKTALIWIHAPRNEKESVAARKRFAFEEIFFIQLSRQRDRLRYEASPAYAAHAGKKMTDKFIGKFPFKLTDAQIKTIDHILTDLAKNHPMSRLLEGDVGSGKTAVAAAAVYAIVMTRPNSSSPTGGFGHLQVAYMAPTEILAQQHFESFMEYFKGTGVQIGLITGSGCKKFPSKVNPNGATPISRAQLLKWTAEGIIPMLIGTHALIEKSVIFKHLALIIIDEQHRFGINQRAKLARKSGILPHLLSMTATPIPRTLALTIYGDLDLSLLDEMPAGRKQIITEIVTPNKRQEAYEKIRHELSRGRQAYVICPRIDEPDPEKEMALIAKSVKAEAERLSKEVFPEFSIDILHGKMRPAEKESVMREFARGETDILVATSVVEVGVNVPNATLIVIEGAERFGLAQLHQLRGRVIRSTHQPYCFIFSETKLEKSLARLKALVTAKNGFELSELDLELRGPGELSG
ncbi:MAG: ATP-dependent DNA helicase RecG, partial [Patescibacteria group bacterium]